MTKILKTFALVIPILLLCGCKSKQSVVTQQTYIADKANEKKWDSLFNARLTKELERFQTSRSEKIEKTLKDVTHIKDSTATRFDANGKKTGEDKYHSEIHYISEKDVQKLKDSVEFYRAYVDSSAFYRSKYDSLVSIKENISNDRQVIEKKLTKWQYVCQETGKIFYCLVLIITLMIIYNTLLKKKGNS